MITLYMFFTLFFVKGLLCITCFNKFYSTTNNVAINLNYFQTFKSDINNKIKINRILLLVINNFQNMFVGSNPYNEEESWPLNFNQVKGFPDNFFK